MRFENQRKIASHIAEIQSIVEVIADGDKICS